MWKLTLFWIIILKNYYYTLYDSSKFEFEINSKVILETSFSWKLKNAYTSFKLKIKKYFSTEQNESATHQHLHKLTLCGKCIALNTFITFSACGF